MLTATLERDHGRERALELIDGIREITIVEQPDWRLVEEAAHVKAQGGLSFADAFCIATAQRHGTRFSRRRRSRSPTSTPRRYS